MADTAGVALREPEKMDWDHYNPQSAFRVPPEAKGPDGKFITYYGIIPEAKPETDDDGFRQYLLDPIKLTRSGPDADGYELRFSRASVVKFGTKAGKPKEVSQVGNLLRGAGITARPQTTVEYDAAMKVAKGRVVPFTIDWSAYNKQTGERVDGYSNFPDDPARPGKKKAILRKGDVYTTSDNKGAITSTKTVQSDVLFANARLRFFIDATKK